MDELNEKLAKWAGFKSRRDNESGVCPIPEFELPDGSKEYKIPNFTSSLDACFEWLVPKLTTWHIVGHIDKTFSAAACIDNYKCGWAEGETPALALCKAIEKLIDEEAKHEAL